MFVYHRNTEFVRQFPAFHIVCSLIERTYCADNDYLRIFLFDSKVYHREAFFEDIGDQVFIADADIFQIERLRMTGFGTYLAPFGFLCITVRPFYQGLTEALREPDAGEQIRLFEGGDAAGLAAARSRAYSAAFYDACFPEAGSAEQALSRERLRFFYRGAANERYLLAPGVYRTGEKPEDFYFHELQVRCPAPFAGRRYLEKLTYMQHYGAPTRLLDITANPLVALYFACAAEPDCDGKVIVFCVEAADVAYASSDRVQMLSHLPELSHADQRHLEALSYRYMLRPGKFPQKSNQKYDDAVLERLYYDIQKENNAFTRDIRPFDLLRPVFVQSNQDNPRILRQDGAFLLSGLDTDEADSDRKLRKHVLKELRIPAGCKAAIVQQLERVNIHQASLFPEPDTVAQYLRRK